MGALPASEVKSAMEAVMAGSSTSKSSVVSTKGNCTSARAARLETAL